WNLAGCIEFLCGITPVQSFGDEVVGNGVHKSVNAGVKTALEVSGDPAGGGKENPSAKAKIGGFPERLMPHKDVLDP
ncbi:MAG: hypothetical protein ORN83_13635, partial [Chthoniobacteraceae bacterium]|nr:hypothetical protein [Chthoniobacteraceae bacterium]